MSTSIKNRIVSLKEYSKISAYPECQGIFEGHVFFSPINPDEEIIKKFKEITEQLISCDIKSENGNSEVKACVLSLDFKNQGYVRVLQSSRYYYADNIAAAQKELQSEADRYQELFDDSFKNGEISQEVNVIREKLEIVATSQGVPVTDEDAKLYPKKYFEFHIRIRRKCDDEKFIPMTSEELQQLKDISLKYSEMFKIPVPLSFNGTRQHQRYLNVRFENIGYSSCMERVNFIEEEINKCSIFEHMKTIAEYVPVDSFRQLDSGWIDF
jgi:hypothetical protein